MTSEPEADVSDVAAQSASDSGDAGALLEVTFQRNPSQKYKYLEAEPKILGVTEIALNVFFMGLGIPLAMSFEYSHHLYAKIISFELMIYTIIRAFSVVVGIIAGSVAIAAQKLHLPTLKACLGMQVITCVTYTCFFFNTMNSSTPGHCWLYNETITGNSTCSLLEEAFIQLTLLDLLMEATQIAISLTLAAYCCKVIACCTPRSHVPVIVMMRPTAPQ